MREQWVNALRNKEILEDKLSHQDAKVTELSQLLDQYNNEISEVKKELYLTENLSDDLLIESINTINDIKSRDKLVERLKDEYETLNKQLETFYSQAQSTTEGQFDQFNRNALFNDLSSWLSQYKVNKEKKADLSEQIKLLQNEVKSLEANLKENVATINELFNFINVQDEEAFYSHYKNYQLYQERLARFNDLSKYLENQDYSYEKSSALSEKTSAKLEEEDNTLSNQVNDYNDQFLEKQQEVSDLNAQINHMETDSTLSNLRHQYYSLKNKMNDIAKDWASLSYLEALISNHIKQIKDKRLPQVIQEATSIFSYLTSNAYVQIAFKDDSITVKHKDGQVFHPLELSQSTKEVLYIALRISLIKTLKPYYSLPIIVDDAIVHFDKNRKKIMLEYLRELSKEHQVLYFTCTKDQIIPNKEILILNKVGEGGK